MFDAACDRLPYALVVCLFAHGVARSRSKRIPVLPRHSALFWRVFLCCVFSVLAKYACSGERPVRPARALPPGWASAGVRGTPQGPVQLFAYRRLECLKVQRAREAPSLPLSLSALKQRHGPASGTPSSHSVLAGYFLRTGRALSRSRAGARLIQAAAAALAASRVAYGHHYAYQAALGALLGYLFGAVCK